MKFGGKKAVDLILASPSLRRVWVEIVAKHQEAEIIIVTLLAEGVG